MSLAIDPDNIDAILLPDGWHTLDEETAVRVDAYELTEHDEDGQLVQVLHGQGVGITFCNDQGQLISAPMTSVLAIRHILRPATS